MTPRTQKLPLDSDALRANLAGTQQEVIIPDRYLPLVEAVRELYGVRAPLKETLAEYFHAFRNADALIEGFQTVLLRNWTYFERSEDRSKAFALLSELVVDLLATPLSNAQTSLLLRQILTWCTNALSGPYPDAYDESMIRVAEAMARIMPARGLAFLERDGLLRALAHKAAAHPPLAKQFTELYRNLLLMGYRRVLERLTISDWATSDQAELNDPKAVAGRFSGLSSERVDALIDKATRAAPEELFSHDLFTYSEILDQAIDQVFRIDDLEDRFAVCLYFMKDDALGYRQNEAMVDLLGVVRELMKPERQMDVDRILSKLTRFFRARSDEFLLMRFQCYEAIGVAIGMAENIAAADHLIEDVLSWKFQYPEIRGATDDWETVVNPYHLPKIRCWMHIIESNPALYERLAAALNVQLRLGGVYIADTDLFQRDVTRFLNADIGPIYFVAKQLLRAFPVYFNDVGAEGELRSVSTEVDEINGRQDTLMHFVRKQSHAEPSNRLVSFSREILRYWITLDTASLEPYLSGNTMHAVKQEREFATGPNEILLALMDVFWGAAKTEPTAGDETNLGSFLDTLLVTPQEELARQLTALAGQDEAKAKAGRRVALMVRTYQLLALKYSLSPDNVVHLIGRHLELDARTRNKFAKAVTAWQKRPNAATRDRLLDASLQVLERLKAIILDPKASPATENIYQKRHIAAGIPSMYGNYSEAKFDALGLSFRVERFVSQLFEELVSDEADTYVTRDSLRRMAGSIRRFERALVVDGVDSRNLGANLRLLEASFSSNNFTFHQYHNVFQFLAGSVTELSSTAILSHDQVLHTVLMHDSRQCEARNMRIDAVAEMVLREVLVSALGMQTLDRYVSSALRQISIPAGRLSNQALTRMMNYDPARLLTPIHDSKPTTGDQVLLGFKGLGLKQMAYYGHRVPEGFILSTELFGVLPALSYRPLYNDTIQRIRQAMTTLEKKSGLRLGDPKNLLTLSIRSGAAISMPGLMTTFVDVGLNDRLAEALSRRPGYEWAAWDSYRRFLQSWAMSNGVNRDFFDQIMNEFKNRYGIGRKSDFAPAHMKELAHSYKNRAKEMGVKFSDDPFRQVVACIRKVLDSWDSEEAKLYRRVLGVAQEWGTAVVVQRMVYGNLSRESGSGVTFTRDPREPRSNQVRLFGDFTSQSQGEDLVGGLVFPWPISEAQRLAIPAHHSDHSLQRDYPEIYTALLGVARDLVTKHEYDAQEIEFTFESASAKDLYILQKRAMVHEQGKDAPYFDASVQSLGTPAAVGLGVSGGAYSGRAAINLQQLKHLAAEAPHENILLLRPDTVPDDIALITKVAGILTARGGATSHAAVTAKRLGKTAVVDCRDLEVQEHEGTATLAGHQIKAGDWLSIDGRNGNIYIGQIPTLSGPSLLH